MEVEKKFSGKKFLQKRIFFTSILKKKFENKNFNGIKLLFKLFVMSCFRKFIQEKDKSNTAKLPFSLIDNALLKIGNDFLKLKKKYEQKLK